MRATSLRKSDDVIIRVMRELDAAGVYPGIETLRSHPELSRFGWFHVRNRRQLILGLGLVEITTTPPDKRTARWHVERGEELDRAAEFIGDGDPTDAEATDILSATREILVAAILRGDAAPGSLSARTAEENWVHKSFGPTIDKIGSMSTTSNEDDPMGYRDACRQIRDAWDRGGLGWDQPVATPRLAEQAA